MPGLPFDPIDEAARQWGERWPGVPAMHAVTSLMRVQQLVLARLDAILKPHGLTFARYEALVLLAFSRDRQLSMSRIGERLMVHPTSATNIVQRLASQGFVERLPNPRDRRGTLARITVAGEAAMEAVTVQLRAERFGLGMLDAAELESLWEVLRGIRVAAGDFDEPG